MYAAALATLLAGSLAVSAKAVPRPLPGRDIEPRDSWWSPTSDPCWSDGADNVRALNVPGYDPSDINSPLECQKACDTAGYNLAGLELGRECWCGNAIEGANNPVDPSVCNMNCPGDDTESCGGVLALSMFYKGNYDPINGPPTPEPEWRGYWNPTCYADMDKNHRLLPDHPSGYMDHRQMTVENCIDACSLGSYTYAGLEYGSECWCSNMMPNYDPVDMAECDMGCTGDAAAVCGGVSRILVYTQSDTSK
ncbi:hypothetical protein PG994_001511 [Apiospora phragmitis]|uniref:WSC domain-containing protein n=1 Tax=Apiospora phragmitis TaxID=2905665 RepID=A0ABR1WTU8_9PEZI